MIEEFKIIMETVGVATESAQEIGILWLCVELVKVILLHGVIVFGVIVSAKLIIRAISIQDSVAFVRKLRNITHPDDRESYWVSLEEKRNIVDTINRGMRKE